MTRLVNRAFVEKLQVVRDNYEDKHGHSPAMDELVHAALNELVGVSRDASTRRWANAQLEKEQRSRRLRRAESLVPSGILDAHDDFYDTFNLDPNSEVDDALAPVNPFSGNPSQFPVFVSAHQLPSISSSGRGTFRRGTAARGSFRGRGGKTRNKKIIRRRKH
jgi:hypothetical protein